MFSLGGVTLPNNTIVTPLIRNIENVRYTYSGKRKSRIRAQKTDFMLTLPSVKASYFNSIKTLKTAMEDISFIYPAEGGGDDITKTVAIGNLPYDYLLYATEGLIQNLIIPLEEI